jgi:hypothetical protein
MSSELCIESSQWILNDQSIKIYYGSRMEIGNFLLLIQIKDEG